MLRKCAPPKMPRRKAANTDPERDVPDPGVGVPRSNGVTLNPGQTTLVREMATSGARLQLAIAPAGSGKTTAMRVLARAWSEEGGTVIGRGRAR